MYILPLTFSLALAISPPADDPGKTMRAVGSIDLQRYSGKWYEIARLPNRFQRDCASDTTATYTLRPDGKITVLNQCRTAEGKVKSARGTARLASAQGPSSKLKVTFFWPFSGDYWVIDLDPDYRWAAIGEPGRSYFWVLSREPRLDEGVLSGILQRATAQGYRLENLIRTPHRKAISQPESQ
jgi:apolipoprotein D and lipocalin family protein